MEDPGKKCLMSMLNSFQDNNITRLDKLLLVLIQATDQTDMDFKKLNTQLLHHTLDKGSRKGNKTIDSSLSRLQ